MTSTTDTSDLFKKIQGSLLNFDPVHFCENYLTLDGKPFRLHGNGYRPLADIYRYVGVKALEKNAKPIIVLKSRRTGITTMACALSMYFMGSGLFGNDKNPPIRIIHAFPQLDHAAAYTKTKLNTMITSSVLMPNAVKGKPKSYMRSKLDSSTDSNDSLHFKQFVGGNHLWIESTGLNSDRLMGRQLCLETELPTPTGFIKLKDLQEGDQLFDEQGNICKITKLHPIDLLPESYRITFDDGTQIDACADHLWLTYTRNDRRFKKQPTVKTTKSIFQTIKSCGENNHSISCTKPLNYPAQNLPLDPYLLGLWLGDGSQKGTIESADPEILSDYEYRILPSSIGRTTLWSNGNVSKSHAYRVKGLTTLLTQLSLVKNTHSKKGDFYNKHIPEIYMHSSFEQRLALLQGLLDTDGHCEENGMVEFVQVREKLAYQVYELVLSLGIKAYISKRESWRYDVQCQDKFRIRFITHLPVFRMKRKAKNIKDITATNLTRRTHRFITNVELIDPKPMRCITVDSPSHLFLVTRKYIPTHNTSDMIYFDEVQSIPSLAIGNALKILNTAKYGRPSKGVQVYFGTPRRKGSDFQKMWHTSSQQYYYLHCERCNDYFPLYTPGSNEWQKIWIHTFIVKCTHCGFEQDKRNAAERGKWFAAKNLDDDDCLMVGFHLNQLYMPFLTREDLTSEMPGVHPINSERVFQNDVLGEFFQGDSSPITIEDIRENCAETERKFRAQIDMNREENKNLIITMGIDYGARADLEQLANPDKAKVQGRSYSTAVILAAKGPGLLSIEFCTKFKRNDLEGKKGLIDQLMRTYNVKLAVGDIGFSHDFSNIMHNAYGDRYLVSRASGKMTAANHIKYNIETFPKEIIFERDYYIGELFEQLKKGAIKFPFGDYEKIAWLIEHCASMELKPSISRSGDPSMHYVKGSTPNDGFMALLNAYIAFKFLITRGFTDNNPFVQDSTFKTLQKPLATIGHIHRRF